MMLESLPTQSAPSFGGLGPGLGSSPPWGVPASSTWGGASHRPHDGHTSVPAFGLSNAAQRGPEGFARLPTFGNSMGSGSLFTAGTSPAFSGGIGTSPAFSGGIPGLGRLSPVGEPGWRADLPSSSGAMAEDDMPRSFSVKDQLGGFGFGADDFVVGGLGDIPMRSSPSAGMTPHGDALYGDPCWVTVFGFPGRSASLVRQQLETLCGPIVEVRHGDGNYMHVRFHSAAAAAQCLALNGRQVLGKLLIGCVPRTSGLAADNLSMRSDGGGDIGGLGQPPIAGRAGALLSPGTSSFDAYGSDGGPPTGPRAAMPAPPAVRGPLVKRGGLWRSLLDLIFDI